MSAVLAPLSRSTALLGLIQKEYPGYHPLLAIARIAHSSDDVKIQLEAHKAIVKYVEPELKSVEVRNNLDARIVRVSLFDPAPVTLDQHGNVLEHQLPPDGKNW